MSDKLVIAWEHCTCRFSSPWTSSGLYRVSDFLGCLIMCPLNTCFFRRNDTCCPFIDTEHLCWMGLYPGISFQIFCLRRTILHDSGLRDCLLGKTSSPLNLFLSYTFKCLCLPRRVYLEVAPCHPPVIQQLIEEMRPGLLYLETRCDLTNRSGSAVNVTCSLYCWLIS